MSSLTGERMLLPTRADLRTASPWVWVLLVVALVAFVVVLVAEIQFGISALSTAAFGAAPAVVAAALMFVSPRERLVRIAAIGFVVPVIVFAMRALFDRGLVHPGLSSDYALLVPRLMEWTDALSSISWLFTAVAVGALALQIGRVRTSRGWTLVAVAIALASAQLVRLIVTWPPFANPDFADVGLPIASLALPALSVVLPIAWGFLLAVAVERRLWFLATAAGATLLISLLSLVSFALSSVADPTSTAFELLLPIFWVLNVVTWTALIAGVLLELPRHGQTIATDRDSASSQELLSRGQ